MKAASQPHFLHSDIVVVGSGPAGMAAALRAQQSGARVLVVEENPTFGGQIWRGADASHLGAQAKEWLREFRDSKINVLGGARVVAGDATEKTLLVETGAKAQTIRFGKLILATGARELFLPFPGWTLPGVMGAGGLQALAKSGLPIAGKRIAVSGSGPLLLAVASYLAEHKAKVVIVAEQASRASLARFGFQLLRHPGKILQAALLQRSLLSVPYQQGSWIEEAIGNGRLSEVVVRNGSKRRKLACDYLAIGYGLVPSMELPVLFGCREIAGAVEVNEWQNSSVAGVFCAGEGTGIGGVDLSLVEGEIAGYAAAGQPKAAQALFEKRAKARNFANLLNRSFALREDLKKLPQADTIVCRCEDVTHARLRESPSFRAAKLQMRCGMGPCQGRVCGPAAEFLYGWKATSVRPPVFPARIGSLSSPNEEAN